MSLASAQFPVNSTLRALSVIVGNTPLLGVHFRYRGRDHVIYAKS